MWNEPAFKRVELKLVAIATNLGKYALINPTCALSSDQLPNSLSRSSTKFLLNTNVIEIRLDLKKVKVKMEYLEKCVVIAYFIGGCPLTRVIQDWLEQLQTKIRLYIHHTLGMQVQCNLKFKTIGN